MASNSDHNSHHLDDNHHDRHAGHSPDEFKQKFWLSAILSLPVLYFSPTIQDLLGYSALAVPGSGYISAIFAVIVFLYGGMVFIQSARQEIRSAQLGMMTLISLAISVAFIYSTLTTLSIIEGMDLWWELATLVTIMLLGHWLEMSSIVNAQGALDELARLLPDKAEVFTGASTKTVAVSQLRVGDQVLVRPGSKVPMDGVVVRGSSRVDESMLTGESKAVKKSKGDELIAGSINSSGSLVMRVSKTGHDTVLAGIMKLVADAQRSRSKVQTLADTAARYLFYLALLAAVLTAIGWLMAGESVDYVVQRVVAVLIIACPHALGLAIPLVVTISTSKSAGAGLLIRERSALEQVRNVDVVLFDKTGTLTTGRQSVVEIVANDKAQMMTIAASLEKESEHSIAKAVLARAKAMRLKPLEVKSFNALGGRGVTAKIGSTTYYVGGPKLIEERGAALTDRLKSATARANANGHTIIYVLKEKVVLGAIMIADTIRKESKNAIRSLRQSGKEVAIVTGDSAGVARWVAGELGIDKYYAEVLPERKAETVRTLQSDGLKVAFVGDGVNDAPALTQADVGIAIGAGTDVAIESAGIVLVSSNPEGVSRAINLSRATYRKMKQNLFWATGYNIVAIPLAAGVLAGAGFVMSPALGAVLMSASTIIVALNAQLLRRSKI